MLSWYRKSLKGTRGFTLVEIMVALLVLTVGFLGVIGLLYTTIDRNRFAGQITEATTLAQDKIEQLKAWGYAATSTINETVPGLTATATTPDGIYTRTARATPSTRYSVYLVTVQWARAGTQHSVSLQTILSQ